VTVIEYVGSGVKNAGNYKISARVDYDRENYNEPKLPVCDFVINKCPVNIPHITAFYNGEGITPVPDSELYVITNPESYIESGKYTVTVRLADTKNYIFAENSSSTATAIFEIFPATLFVSVSDIRLRLFEPIGNVDYMITAGRIFGKDTVKATVYTEGDKIYLHSTNKNYTFNVTPGRLVRLPYPTFEGGIIILCVAIALGVGISIAWVIFVNRRKISTAAAIARCRWHNRNFVAPEPREVKGIDIFIEKDKEENRETETEYFEEESEDEDFSEKFSVIDLEVDAERADMLITDALAKSLLKKDGEVIYTDGNAKCIINVDTLSDNFYAGERIDINLLKKKGIIDGDVSYIKVLARGRIDKPLTVYANEFSLSAVKMIALTGGQSIKATTKPTREKG
jgi:hypothetical protein